MKYSLFILGFFIGLMPLKMCIAQDVIKQPAQLKFQATYYSPRTYTDTAQKFNLQTYKAELAISLGRIKLDTGIITFNGSIKQQIQPIQLFDSDPQRLLLTSSIGIRTMYLDYKRIHGYLVFSNRLQVQSDENNWSKQSPRYTGTLLYSRMNAKKLRWNYGLAYSYVYGKGLVLPLIGFIYKPDSHQTWRAVLPFLFSYQYKSQSNIFTLAWHPAGGRNAITSPWGNYSGENLQLNYRQSMLGFRYGRRFFQVGIIGLEAGLCSKARITLYADTWLTNQKLTTEPGFYSGLFFRLPLYRAKGSNPKELVEDYELLLDNF
jgi:hypothetical protein